MTLRSSFHLWVLVYNITTLGSSCQAFPCVHGKASSCRHGFYNYAFVKEGSQASGDDVFCVYNKLTYFNHRSQGPCTRLVLFRDGYQLGVATRFLLSQLLKFSFVKRLFLGATPLIVMQFNTQNRIPAEIKALSNVISRQKLFTHITRERHWVRRPVLLN